MSDDKHEQSLAEAEHEGKKLREGLLMALVISCALVGVLAAFHYLFRH
jgi:hypothetical protein